MYAMVAILALALGGANVYRWVDADGVTHYSDQPHAGAERITIIVSKPTGKSSASTGTSRGNADSGASQTPRAAGYQSLVVTSPTQEQVLWNIEGQLEVAATVQPALQPGDSLVFTLDGRTAQAAPGATQAKFSEIYRGEHQLAVDVVNNAGRSLMSSAPVTFYVRQTSIANPSAPPTSLPPRP